MTNNGVTRRHFMKSAGCGLLSITASSPLLELLIGNRELCFAEELPEVVNEPWPSKDTLGTALKMSLNRGANFADIFCERTIKRQFEISHKKISNIHFSIDQGAGARVLYGERTGFAYCESLNPKSIEETAELAASLGSRSVAGVFQPLQHVHLKTDVAKQIIPLETLPEDKRITIMREAETAALDFNPFISNATIEYYEEIKEILISNTEGIFVHDVLPMIYFKINVLAKNSTNRHMGRTRISGRTGFELFNNNLAVSKAQEAAKEAITMLDANDSPSGEMPVVVNGGWGGVLFHEAVGHGLEGDAISKGASFFVGKKETRIASDVVTFVDDATIPTLRGSYNIDDEGVPSARKILIEKGILKKFMMDKLSGQKLNEPSTGNGRRQSFRFPPLVRMSNTFILDGPSSPEEIISSTKKGIFAKSFDGGVVDTTSGNFTFTVREAYLIENGELTKPIRRVTLIGKGSEALKSIDMVGNDLRFGVGTCGKGQWVPVTSGQPTLRLSKIVVGGTRG